MFQDRQLQFSDNGHRFYLFTILAIGIFLVVIAFTIARERTSSYGRASPNSTGGGIAMLSRENSYIFASPISAKANGNSIIRVTVFLMNNQGMGISGQKPVLKSDNTLSITPVQQVSDSFGRAQFDVSSNTSGDYRLTAEVEGITLQQNLTISFR
jgi:hypothetical protein